MTNTTETVVDTTVPDANALNAVEGDAAPSPAGNQPADASDKPKGVQKRLDELTRNWREAERREAALLSLLQQRDQLQPKADTPAPAKALADFDFDEVKYREYLQDELRSSVSAEVRAAAKAELAAERERQATEQRKISFRARVTEFAKTVEDYDEVVRNPDLAISADMAEVIEDSDDGPALAYYLGKNQDIAERIAQLPPKAAARELGKIEAHLAFEREKVKAEKVSKAPPPPPKVEGTDTSTPKVSSTDPESDKLSDDEWVRLERARMARKAKAEKRA